MQFYAIVTGVERSGKTGLRFLYELRVNGTDAAVDTGSTSLQFLPPGTINPDTTSEYTRAEKRQYYRSQIREIFKSFVERAEEADAEFDAVANSLFGFRYPAAV